MILVVSTGAIATDVRADPAADALAKLNELSRQAESATEAMHSARLSLNDKVAAQGAADRKHADALADVEIAQRELATFQAQVDKVAAATYMGGRTDGLTGILTANSPQQLIDQLAVRQTMATEMSAAMARFRDARRRADAVEKASAASAAQARIAAEQAAAVRADLQAKQSRLQAQISDVKAQYDTLTPEQQAVLAGPPPPEPPPGNDVLASGDVPPPIDGVPPSDPAIPDAAPNPGDGGGNSAVVQAALTRIGSPYSWGGSGPNAFDCSGLIMWAFQQTGRSLPHSSQALAAGGQPVARSDLQPGDIVTFYSDISHAGIYIGDGMMVHASTYGTPVRVAPVDSSPFHNARRY